MYNTHARTLMHTHALTHTSTLNVHTAHVNTYIYTYLCPCTHTCAHIRKAMYIFPVSDLHVSAAVGGQSTDA